MTKTFEWESGGQGGRGWREGRDERRDQSTDKKGRGLVTTRSFGGFTGVSMQQAWHAWLWIKGSGRGG